MLLWYDQLSSWGTVPNSHGRAGVGTAVEIAEVVQRVVVAEGMM